MGRAVSETIIATRPPEDGRQWDAQCARCGSTASWVDCENCDDGVSGHDCGEDSCCCLDPEENLVCQFCRGNGGWTTCISDHEWCDSNPRPGREDVPSGRLEWFCLEERRAP